MDFESIKEKVPSNKKLGLYGGLFLVSLLVIGLVSTVPTLGEITVYGEPDETDGDEPQLILGGTVDATLWQMALVEFQGCNTPEGEDQEINCEAEWGSIVSIDWDSSDDEEIPIENGDGLEAPPEPDPNDY